MLGSNRMANLVSRYQQLEVNNSNQWLWILHSIPYVFVFFVFTYIDHHPFFWDTVQLGAKHGLWFFDHSFDSCFLPDELDSGHPPSLGMLLALAWSVFGQSLATSHWLMFPFVCTTIYFTYHIGKMVVPNQSGWWFVLLVYADPVLMTQSILISPDVLLMTFFTMALYGIINDRRHFIWIGILGLGMVSLRGMMTAFALFFFEVSWRRAWTPSKLLDILWYYLPGGLFGLGFLAAHYVVKGWIGYHEASPWAPSFYKMDFTGMLKNTMIIGWRLLDYGRWVIFPVLFWLYTSKVNPKSDRPFFISLMLILGIFLLPSMIIHQYLSAHRYLLPLLFSIQLCSYALLFNTSSLSSPLRKTLFAVFIISLISGHLWVYPLNIAQGWDATLAHLPYYQSKAEMLAYLKNQEIDCKEIGTVFPEIGPLHHRHLDQQLEGFVPLDFHKNRYILVSNVMNDITPEQWTILQHHWTLNHQIHHWPITLFLYQKQPQ